MTIKNELSSEIASAILTAKADSPGRLNELKKIVLEVHAVLQQMSEQTHTQSSDQSATGQNETLVDYSRQ